ncbi:cerebellin-4-like [Menidia menidia]
MRAIVLLCLLHAVFGQNMDFSWNGPLRTTPRVEPDPEPEKACSSNQESCGCCVMQTHMNRVEKFFNFSVEKMSEQVMKTRLELNNRRASRSAFSVALNNDTNYGCFQDLASDGVVIYKHVFLNLGDGYNTQTGIFTAPRSGVYSLAATVHTSVRSNVSQVTSASLLVNGKPVAVLFERNGMDAEDSNTVVAAVQLKAGDKVAVSLLRGSIICDDFKHYNTFTGYLLFATDE